MSLGIPLILLPMLQKILLGSILLFLGLKCLPQTTFNQFHRFGFKEVELQGVISTDSAIYGLGRVEDFAGVSNYGIIFIKYDLQGNPQKWHIIKDSLKWYEVPTGELLQTYDKNFVATGRVDYYRNPTALVKGFFIKYSPDADVLSYQEYEPDPPPPIYNWDIMHLEAIAQTPDSGFVVVGSSTDNPQPDILALKLDKEGHEIWRKHYGSPLVEEGKTCWVDQKGDIYIGGKEHNFPLPDPENVGRNYLIKTDAQGDVIWEYRSPITELYTGIHDLLQLSNGDWAFLTYEGEEYPHPGDSTQINIGEYRMIEYLDSNFNRLWQTRLDAMRDIEKIYEIEETSDGGIVAIGKHRDYDSVWGTKINKGWVTKVSAHGDILWNRYYKHIIDSTIAGSFLDITVAQDEGLYLVGTIDSFRGIPIQNPPSFEGAWLLKTDQHGCLVPGCHLSDAIDPDKENLGRVKTFPNPASDHLYVDYQADRPRAVQVRLLDLEGRLVHQTQGKDQSITYIFPLADLPAGIYLLQVEVEGRVVYGEKVVKLQE